ncbi:hypothetical protein [Streptomyces sp. NRRL B-24484]|uniref:hypothetical protein n=1 Tax=Streptomyces sp. NRRL B-24484 TaxID=1463833 RepID=UPI0004C1F587|nr:hypothetical protein [Streptomyces sp. NRRL B-24484]
MQSIGDGRIGRIAAGAVPVVAAVPAGAVEIPADGGPDQGESADEDGQDDGVLEHGGSHATTLPAGRERDEWQE